MMTTQKTMFNSFEEEFEVKKDFTMTYLECLILLKRIKRQYPDWDFLDPIIAEVQKDYLYHNKKFETLLKPYE